MTAPMVIFVKLLKFMILLLIVRIQFSYNYKAIRYKESSLNKQDNINSSVRDLHVLLEKRSSDFTKEMANRRHLIHLRRLFKFNHWN